MEVLFDDGNVFFREVHHTLFGFLPATFEGKPEELGA
jgi:hypothetical protein